MCVLTVDPQPSKPSDHESSENDSEDDDGEVEFVNETDAERREALFASEKADDLKSNKLASPTSWKDFDHDFNFFGAPPQDTSTSKPGKSTKSGLDVTIISSDEDQDVPVASGSTICKQKKATSKGELPVRNANQKLSSFQGIILVLVTLSMLKSISGKRNHLGWLPSKAAVALWVASAD